MPKAAADIGAACKILAPPAIATELIEHVTKRHVAAR
jgi:hypothetical protein